MKKSFQPSPSSPKCVSISSFGSESSTKMSPSTFLFNKMSKASESENPFIIKYLLETPSYAKWQHRNSHVFNYLHFLI